MNNIVLYVILGLAVALVGSGAGNLYQWQVGKRAVAECEAARLQVVADLANGTAAVEKERADTVVKLGDQAALDNAARLKALDDAIARIGRASSAYAAAAKRQPLPDGCRASPDRVEAVNKERGYDQ
jgi:hypothetical protein